MTIFFLVFDITKVGGTEKATINLANALVNKYNVTIVSISRSNNSLFFELDPKIKLAFLTSSEFYGKRKFSYLYIITKLIFFKNSKGIWIGTTHALNILLIIKSFFKNIKVIGVEHVPYDSIPRVSNFFRSILYRKLSSLVLLSASDKKKFEEFTNSIRIIPNFISSSSTNMSTCKQKKLITVGRLSKEKAFDELLYIVKDVFIKYPNWALDIYGEGEEKDRLYHIIKELKISNNVNIHNFSNKIELHLIDASIFLMTSKYEAFPMVLLEAKSCGLPVISYSSNGPNCMVNNSEDGFLISNGDRNKMTEKILFLIENDEIRRRFGINAKLDVEKYSATNVLVEWEKVLNE